MTEEVKSVKEAVHEAHGWSNSVAKALDRMDAIIMTLDALKASYTVTYDGRLITVNAEPMLSYDRAILTVEVDAG